MNILLTGIDGYVGWPTALKLSKAYPEARIIGVDNYGRRDWVAESGSVSAIPVYSMDERIEAAKEHGFTNISFIEGDLTDRDFMLQLFALYKFDAVLHLAAQPSAPYAHINGERAAFTQINNVQSTLNLLWAVKETGLAKTCKFVETTTTGVYGAPSFPIPEGFVTAENKGQKDTVPFGNMAGSWYHMSKCHDVNNLWLANRQWGLSITDLRTSIVYGTSTDETALDERMATRFDFDFFFGVVMNRFCAMALTGHPITIYGKGLQKKPCISVEDCAQSCVNALATPKDGKFTVYNQTTELAAIKDLGVAIREAGKKHGIDVDLSHIENPRVEDEEHNMEMDTAGFESILPKPRYNQAQGIEQIIGDLKPYTHVLKQYKDRFLSA